jgi:hypothetical protein
MFKMFPPTFFLVPVAWLTVLALSGINAATPVLDWIGITPKASWAVLLVQGILTLLFVTPAWRWVWRKCPALNRWVFPDLNGEWDITGETNWPRIDELLKAGNHQAPQIDMRDAPEDRLPALGKLQLRARIKQSWLNIKIEVWDPKGVGPIKDSETLTVEPFRGKEGRHGLVYVYEQENRSRVNSDDRVFLGAARVFVDRHDPEALCGQMWSDRMWRRGMNTAAEIRFTRPKAAPKSKSIGKAP